MIRFEREESPARKSLFSNENGKQNAKKTTQTHNFSTSLAVNFSQSDHAFGQ